MQPWDPRAWVPRRVGSALGPKSMGPKKGGFSPGTQEHGSQEDGIQEDGIKENGSQEDGELESPYVADRDLPQRNTSRELLDLLPALQPCKGMTVPPSFEDVDLILAAEISVGKKLLAIPIFIGQHLYRKEVLNI